eukprot:3940531-Rhodomonas_salina.1
MAFARARKTKKSNRMASSPGTNCTAEPVISPARAYKSLREIKPNSLESWYKLYGLAGVNALISQGTPDAVPSAIPYGSLLQTCYGRPPYRRSCRTNPPYGPMPRGTNAFCTARVLRPWVAQERAQYNTRGTADLYGVCIARYSPGTLGVHSMIPRVCTTGFRRFGKDHARSRRGRRGPSATLPPPGT